MSRAILHAQSTPNNCTDKVAAVLFFSFECLQRESLVGRFIPEKLLKIDNCCYPLFSFSLVFCRSAFLTSQSLPFSVKVVLV
ncbi:hypothetical protein CEXT_92661 [Caerostris extrusa]|uniref:Uncharacterized protein n=1 Tax=Caerostris extrusa TaxID=172846 RepID=A0AAV4XFL6_CAEEX|nr:hypothetical protein CEXT_92661 [Caerostris extrusa]